MNDLIRTGNDLFKKKDYQKSLNIFLEFIQTNPNNIQALIFVAMNLMFLNRFEEAINFLNKIEKLDAKIPECYFNRALCYTQLKNPNKSIENYVKAIELRQSYHQAYINLGVLLQDLGRLDDAINIYNKGLENLNEKLDCYINLSGAYKLKHDTELVKKYALKALEIDNKNTFALNNLGTSLIDEGDLDYAITILKKAIQINPNFAMLHNNLGIAYELQSNYITAIESYEAAIKIDKNYHDPYFNISQIQLSNNDFEKGWKNYEHRWHKTEKRPVEIQFKKPRWNPSMGFEKILIWGEQGMGEQILFSSILQDLVEKFESVLLMVEDRLCRLFQEAYPEIQVISKSIKVDESLFDYHLPLGSLACYFRTNIDDFKKQQILKLYNPNDEFDNQNKNKIKCAISWKSANPYAGQAKSISLELLKEILKTPNIDFYDIQYTNEDHEIKEFKEKNNITIHQIQGLDKFNDIYKLTHFINTCDFVITVSNTNAHLAASIGKPVYLLLSKERGKFWYWDNFYKEKNIWYPSVKIFKQNIAGEWDAPINNLKNFLINNY